MNADKNNSDSDDTYDRNNNCNSSHVLSLLLLTPPVEI